MGINLYLDENLSDSEICQLLEIPETKLGLYQEYLKLETHINSLENEAEKFDLEQSLYVLTTAIKDLSRFIDYKLSGLGNISLNLTESYSGSTKDQNKIRILLATVGRSDLANKVEEVNWG